VAVWQFDNLVEGQRPFERYVAAVAPSPVIDLTDGFAAYEQKLRIKSPQFCRDIARRARKLDRETGGLRFTADSRNIGELRTLVRWKSDQYRRNGWSNIFDRPWVVDLIEYLFSTHSDRFGGLLSVLYAGETPVAAHFGLRGSNILAHWFPAYDPGFSKQSPGLIQHLRMAEETAAMGVHIIDMGTGPERYKQTLKSRDLFVSKGVVARSPSLASAYRARGALARWARHELKRYPSLFHAADRLLGHYGQIG
jgi:CelD/BcsL family acetyltransferase involved in cellulose biosynthesis